MSENDQTIRQFLIKNLKSQKKARLAKLVELSAPKVIIEQVQSEIDGDGGVSTVGKIKDFGSLQIVKFDTEKYRHGTGVTFTIIGKRTVKLIPGPHGMFLVEDK